jgi:hypothetical protein
MVPTADRARIRGRAPIHARPQCTGERECRPGGHATNVTPYLVGPRRHGNHVSGCHGNINTCRFELPSQRGSLLVLRGTP